MDDHEVVIQGLDGWMVRV